MKILFICPNWAGLARPIVDEMRRQHHEVVHLDHSDFSDFSYADRTHRILAKAYQVLTKKSYKHYSTEKQITRTINSFFLAREPFDMVIMTEPNLFSREQLTLIKNHSNTLVASLWDSLTKSPSNGANLDLFDTVFSYDIEDCEKFGFIKVNNYLDPTWISDIAYDKCEYDVFSVMSFTKDRYKQAVKFLDENKGIKPNIYFYVDHNRKRKYISDERIKVIDHIMLGGELKENIQNSRAVLDLLQGHQAGLSFRVYESIGYQRKLITTNKSIQACELFIKQNMHILDDTYYVPKELFSSSYLNQKRETLGKYSLKSWVEKVASSI